MRIQETTDSPVQHLDISRLTAGFTDNLQRLLGLFQDHGFTVRIVGGAVRDLLLGRDPRDIDLGTDAMPEEIIFVLERGEIPYSTKGISHGTLKAIFPNEEEYEITALDYAIRPTPDGQITMDFSRDWRKDAARRDFTINAMSLDLDGGLYDYFGGVGDLGKQRVRVIGDPEERFGDDPRLILRFFKACSFFPNPSFSKDTIAAINRHKDRLDELSERMVRFQMQNISKGPSGKKVRMMMCKIGVERYFDLDCEETGMGRGTIREARFYKHPSNPEISMVGYWYNPSTGKHFEVSWGGSPEEIKGKYEIHHLDIVMDHPDLFGLTNNQDWEDFGTDEAVYHGVKYGWARISISNYTRTFEVTLDAVNKDIARAALRWVLTRHPEIESATVLIGFPGNSNMIRLEYPEMEKFVKRGILPR